MEKVLELCGVKCEYDFIAAWIKYIRLKRGYSQEYVCHGICSVSYLSSFENGKRTLGKEAIEDILKKLDIDINKSFQDIGMIRYELNDMLNDIESFNNKGAEEKYNKLCERRKIIDQSPYSIEFKIYEVFYRYIVKEEKYETLKKDIDILDKIMNSLDDELKHLYLGVSGAILAKSCDIDLGVNRIRNALEIKDTAWTNYSLGIVLCFSSNPGYGAFYLKKALYSYESVGRYLNAIWCHNYLGICYVFLKMYNMAEQEFKAALNFAEHFDLDEIIADQYDHLSDLYYRVGDYETSFIYSKKALEVKPEELFYIYNYVAACVKLKKEKEYDEVFKKYLSKEYESSNYYYLFYFQYLCVYKFDDDIFYESITKTILPYFEKKNEGDICRDLTIKLIEHLEKKRKYKEANKLYKKMLSKYIAIE